MFVEFKRYWLVAVLIAVIFSATGCAGNTETPATPHTPVSFDGTWVPTESDVQMVATISHGTIEILWDPKDTKALYWKGTFPTKPAETLVSKGDVETMSASLLASQDSSKTFTYEDGELSYDVTVTGVTRTVHLERE